jgi:type IV pilus assembly protein PilM
MGFFKTKESFLGVDIGTASIKLVELEPWMGKPKLFTYGYIDIVTDIINSKTPEAQKKIADSLRILVKKSGARTTTTIAALPTFSVFNSIISLPAMSEKDLPGAIRWEAKKYIPLPLEEMVLDWKIIKHSTENIVPQEVRNMDIAKDEQGKKRFAFNFSKKKEEGDGKNQAKPIMPSKSAPQDIRVLVTAAPQNLVNRYMAIFKMAGLKLISLETESFALSRSLIGQDQSTVLIIDIGSITSDICVIKESVPILNRSIDIGGLSVSRAIADSLKIDLERAEQFKRDFGLGSTSGIDQKGVNKTIASALSPIINEIKYVLDLYQSQENQLVEKIVLTGGTALLPNLDQYLQELFNKPVIIGNPWDRIIYPPELKPVLDEIGSRLTVSIGLAMRDIH